MILGSCKFDEKRGDVVLEVSLLLLLQVWVVSVSVVRVLCRAVGVAEDRMPNSINKCKKVRLVHNQSNPSLTSLMHPPPLPPKSIFTKLHHLTNRC